MEEFWRKARSFGLGLWDFTKEKVDAVVDEMIKRGEISQPEREGAVQQLLERAKAEQAAFQEKLTAAIRQVLSDMGVARSAELEALEKRVAALEEQLKNR
jgi:polyhydroxyalkanoate synthesis regulator phasin